MSCISYLLRTSQSLETGYNISNIGSKCINILLLITACEYGILIVSYKEHMCGFPFVVGFAILRCNFV